MGNVNTKHNASDEAPTYFPYSEEEDLGAVEMANTELLYRGFSAVVAGLLKNGSSFRSDTR